MRDRDKLGAGRTGSGSLRARCGAPGGLTNANALRIRLSAHGQGDTLVAQSFDPSTGSLKASVSQL
jgi:hypothetical protein